MKEPEPWEFTGWGDLTREHRLARRALDEEREIRLQLAGVDPRLIDFVWRAASIRTSALVEHDLRHVGWLDDLVIEADDPAVPLCALEFEERGVIARHGALFERTPTLELERDTSWVWEALLGPGLQRAAAALAAGEPDPSLLSDAGELDVEGLVVELGLLGGPALDAFTRAALGQPSSMIRL